MYVEGEVKFVKAVEFGAEAKESRSCNSCGLTVAMFVVDVEDEERFALTSYIEWNAVCVEAAPSNISSPKRSTSWKDMLGVCGTCDVLAENRGT